MTTYFLAAVACLVMAQIVGVYALASRKADLVFAVVMVVLLAMAAALGGAGAVKLRP